MRIGYLVPEFPGQTHIFFWREISLLRSLKTELFLLSTRRPAQASRHAFAQDAQAETSYLFPPHLFSVLWACLKHPTLLASMLSYLWHLEQTSAQEKLLLLGLIPSALDLNALCARRKIKHVHGHSCANVAHILALASLAKTFSYSLSLHGDLQVYGKSFYSKFRRAQFIACVTYDLQRQVHHEIHIERERLPVIRMGVDTESFVPRPRVSDSVPRLITVARLHECKGHLYALKALTLLKQENFRFRYQIVGDGEEKSALAAAIAEYQLTDEVELLGTRGEHEVLSLLQNSQIFLLPSIGFGEAAPVSVMEAMACGLAVVASVIGGTAEMIESGKNGILVPQRGVSEMKDAIRLLIENPELCQTMGKAARATAVEQFSAENFAKKLQQRLQACLS